VYLRSRWSGGITEFYVAALGRFVGPGLVLQLARCRPRFITASRRTSCDQRLGSSTKPIATCDYGSGSNRQ
jgi:hypothetical protein